MRLTTFVCIWGHIFLLNDVSGFVCEVIEDLPEGEVVVNGEEVIIDGVTDVEGNIPTSGNVVFEGPVRAAGKVTIVGSSGPMLSTFGLGPSLVPPMMMPPYYYPCPIYPSTFLPAVDNDMAVGYGCIEASGDNLFTIGETLVEGMVPIAGNVCFDGGVQAYGKVKIFARF